MPKIIVFLALTIAIYIGVSWQPDLPELYGRWEWVETTGGFAGVRKTPDSEGYNEEAVFSRGGKIQIYRNNQVVEVGTFKVSNADTILGDGTLIKYNYRDVDDIVLIRDNKLTLINNVMDGFRRSYRKKKET